MKGYLPILISAVLICALVVILSGKLKFSSRYERKPSVLNTWSAQDQGLDPTDEKIS